jgi:hypothetical protein
MICKGFFCTQEGLCGSRSIATGDGHTLSLRFLMTYSSPISVRWPLPQVQAIRAKITERFAPSPRVLFIKGRCESRRRGRLQGGG